MLSGGLMPYRWQREGLIHGPEIGFARELQKHMPDDYVFIKATGNIHPDLPDFLWAIDGSYMATALSFYWTLCTEAPMAILTDQGLDEAISEKRWRNYGTNLFNIIGALRDYFQNPRLPFLIGQSPNSSYAAPERMAFIRKCQRQASIELPRVGLAKVDDLTPYVNGHHLTSAAQLEFGRRFAEALISLSADATIT